MKTKYILGIFAVFCLLLSGCKVGNVASSQGLSDQAFLFFTSTHKYRTPVSVTIDNGERGYLCCCYRQTACGS